jgi:hypothetical protein
MPSRSSQRISLVVAAAAIAVVVVASAWWGYRALADLIAQRSPQTVSVVAPVAGDTVAAIRLAAIEQGDGTRPRFFSYQHAVRLAADRFPRLFFGADAARKLGLRITPNTYEISDRPRPVSTNRAPFPGLTNSPLVSAFYDARFLLLKAQTFQLGDEPTARFTVQAWLFNEPEGAERGFAALRDLGGREAAPGDFAPLAATRGTQADGLFDLFWVRDNLLLQVSHSLPNPDDPDARRAFEAVVRTVDRRAQAASDQRSADLAAGDPVRRLLALRLDPSLFGDDLEPWPEASDVTTDPMRGSTAAASLDVELTQLGQQGSQRQAIRIAGQDMAHLELAAQIYPSDESATRALEAIASRYGAEPVTGTALGDGVVGRVVDAGYGDLWWQRGPYVLRASVIAGDPIADWLERRDALAEALDEKAREA